MMGLLNALLVDSLAFLSFTPPTCKTNKHVSQQEQMAERVMAYDPEAEVAVMFAFKGQVRCLGLRTLGRVEEEGEGQLRCLGLV